MSRRPTTATEPESRAPRPAPPEPRDGQGGDGHPPAEVGGRAGPEPTRYGDWEVNGICTDF